LKKSSDLLTGFGVDDYNKPIKVWIKHYIFNVFSEAFIFELLSYQYQFLVSTAKLLFNVLLILTWPVSPIIVALVVRYIKRKKWQQLGIDALIKKRVDKQNGKKENE